jgi:hypothetical protein
LGSDQFILLKKKELCDNFGLFLGLIFLFWALKNGT